MGIIKDYAQTEILPNEHHGVNSSLRACNVVGKGLELRIMLALSFELFDTPTQFPHTSYIPEGWNAILYVCAHYIALC